MFKEFWHGVSVSAAVAARMVALVEAEADLTVAELQERIAAETGVRMSWSLVRLWVGRLGLRLKKSHSMPSSATRKRTFNGAKSSSKLSRPSRRNG